MYKSYVASLEVVYDFIRGVLACIGICTLYIDGFGTRCFLWYIYIHIQYMYSYATFTKSNVEGRSSFHWKGFWSHHIQKRMSIARPIMWFLILRCQSCGRLSRLAGVRDRVGTKVTCISRLDAPTSGVLPLAIGGERSPSTSAWVLWDRDRWEGLWTFLRVQRSGNPKRSNGLLYLIEYL